MRQSLGLISFLFALFSGCEKNDDLYIRSSFLIVGDSINCSFVNFNPDLVFSSTIDSFDINSDDAYDIEFSRNFVFIDSCEEFFENCPPDVICDCYPTIYTDYGISLSGSMEIAINVDSTIHEFAVDDTISGSLNWSKKIKYPLFHRAIPDTYWPGYIEFLLGLKKTQGTDTLYSWIKIGIDNSGFIIKELAIQK